MNDLIVTRPPARAGMAWFQEGWRLFLAAPLSWMGMAAMALLALILLGSLPQIGGAIVQLLSPFLVAGFMSASRVARAGSQPVTFLYLADGFRQAPRPLVAVGAVYLLASLLVDQLMRQLGGEGFQELLRLSQEPQPVDPEAARAILEQAAPALLAGLALYTPVLLATWFAPALILFDRYGPGRALYWSLWTCLVNWRPMLVYTLLLTAAGTVAMLIPFGLGMLVFVPLALASSYVAYTAMFAHRREGLEATA